MKKQIISLLCVLSLLTAAPLWALAAEQEPAQEGAQETPAPAADEQGTLSFENLERRVREGNLTMRSVDESMARLDAMDRKQAYDTLLEAHNSMTDMLFNYAKMGNTYAGSGEAGSFGAIYTQMDAGYSAAYLSAQQEQLLTQLEALKPEEYEKTYREAVWQMETGRNQIIFGAQTLYITTLSLERTLADGQRGLAALDRTVAEMEKRFELGQISQLTLLELKKTRTETASSLTSLSLQIERLKSQLCVLVGESPSQELSLLSLPAVTAEQLLAMNPETDLAAAKEQSLDLYLRQKEIDTAKEDLEDMSSGYQKDMAQHNYNALVYARDAAIQSFELSFLNLSRAVTDNAQLLEAAKESLAFQEKSCEASLLKHERGMISDNDLATAKEALDAARSKLSACSDNLLSAYNNYQWALRGIINE